MGVDGNPFDRIQWDDSGPQDRGPFIPIMSPRPGQQLRCLITSADWQGVYTHFHESRTTPCLGDDLACEGCYRRRAKRWKAYVAGIMAGVGRQCLVELTIGALDSCDELKHSRGNLRGRYIILWRANMARNAPVRCKLEDFRGDLHIPAPFDIHAALCRIWGITQHGINDRDGAA